MTPHPRRAATLLTGLTCLALVPWAGPSASAASAAGGVVAVWAGDGNYAPITPGPALASPMYYPANLATDRAGTVYVAFDSYSDQGYALATITRAGVVSYLTNSARNYGTPVAGPALASPYQEVSGLAAAPDGTVYAADASSHVLTRVRAGVLSIVAGTGSSGSVAAGPATASPMTPGALAFGPEGSVYVADRDEQIVSRISPTGTLSVVAGNRSSGTPVTGGLATSSPFSQISAIAVDAAGNLFIADRSENCVTMVDATSHHLVPTVGTCGSSGAAVPGPATSSLMNQPKAIALDPDGSLYVADYTNDAIEKVTDAASGSGTLSIVGGDGTAGSFTPGTWTATHVRGDSLAVARDRTVYYADSGGTEVYRVAAAAGQAEAPPALTATAGNARATLSFLPPDDDGNTGLLRYEYSIDGGSWHTLATTAATGGRRSGLVTGLTNGRRYAFRVRAVTSFGDGLASSTANATPTAAPRPTSWFKDVIGPAERAKEIAIPRDPTRYRGPRQHTKARNRTSTGRLAVPVPVIKGRALAALQAAVLSGDGLFDFNSSRLTAEGRRQVRLLVPALRRSHVVVCEGYTDYGATVSWEYRLSRARARRVCDALGAAGVVARFRTGGFGPQRPVVVGGPRSARQENRRVVVLVQS